MKKLTFAILLAAIWWFIMFSQWTKEFVNFWFMMGMAAVLLSSYALYIGEVWKRGDFRFSAKAVILGVASALLLWGVFYVGDKVAACLFDFAKDQVQNVYSLRDGENPLRIVGLLCLIGPAEEIFWRGYVQEKLSKRFTPNIGFVLATIVYTLVHVWSFNLMLLLAAGVVGTAWGLMYRFNKNLTTLIISHTLWDIAVFIVFPILS